MSLSIPVTSSYSFQSTNFVSKVTKAELIKVA